MIKPKKILIDFDGTCTTHEFPEIGRDIGSVPVLKELVAAGHKLILFTMRSDKFDNTRGADCIPETHNGPWLTNAVNWFKENDIPLYGIQTDPEQHTWTTSPKAYGNLHIDDAGLNAPLKWDNCPNFVATEFKRLCTPTCELCKGKNTFGRPYYDWKKARELLVANGYLPEKNNVSQAAPSEGTQNN